jgi:peptidoglycan hydrolase FlgJ
MNLTIQPLQLLPLPNSIESKGFSSGALQKALSIQPVLATQAATQAMSGSLLSKSPTLNPLKPTLNPLKPTLNPLSGVKTHSDAELKKVSKNFEAIFMRMLFKEMRNSVQKSGLMGNSKAMEFFETMQDEQMSEKLASAGGIGIGNIIYQRLKASTVPHQKTFS